MARFWIRLRATEIHLPAGEVMIGRGPECFFRIDEPQVSRRHARLRITESEVFLEDLGSRNGSLVNGKATPKDRPCRLGPGDLICIGSQEFTLECDDEAAGPRPTARLRQPEDTRRNILPGRPSATTPSGQVAVPTSSPTAQQAIVPPQPAQTTPNPQQYTSGALRVGSSGPYPAMDAIPPAIPGSAASLGHCKRCGTPQGDAAICPRCGNVYRNEFTESPVTTTGRGSSYKLFWSLSDKVLHLGRVDEAERMMGPRLQEMLMQAERGDIPDEVAIGETMRRALRLASATGRGTWFGWIFDYARACRYSMPLMFLDELYAHMFTHRPPVGQQLLGYSRVLSEDNLILRLVALRRLCSD